MLVPVKGTAQATCASADSGGSGGLTIFEAVLNDVRTGERAFMSIDSAMEITESGSYPVRIEIGRTTTEGVLDIRIQRK